MPQSTVVFSLRVDVGRPTTDSNTQPRTTTSGQCVPQIMLGMPDCSHWGGKYWDGQRLRAIRNCLKLLEWAFLRNVNRISYTVCFSASVGAGYQSSL